MNYCKDCKHAVSKPPSESLTLLCGKTGDTHEDPVWGITTLYTPCYSVREDESRCGKSAKWFEPVGDTTLRLALLHELIAESTHQLELLNKSEHPTPPQ